MNNLNNTIKKEADEILYENDLYNILHNYTKKDNIYVSGSYELNLMIWRDLDIFIDIENISQDNIYDLVGKVINKFRPVWLETKDTSNENTGCPKGYFLGFETLKVNNQLWNIDIWVTDKKHITNHVEYMNKVKSKLNDNTRTIIMNMKKRLIECGEYGSKFFSIDIYNGVLFEGITKLEELRNIVDRD